MRASAAFSPSKQAEQCRQDGNLCFKKDRFGAAIDAYTEAITLCPNVSVYWTNRALCHRKRNDWPKVEEDCRKAIELDNNSLKDHAMEEHFHGFGMCKFCNSSFPVVKDDRIMLEDDRIILWRRAHGFYAHYMLGLALLQRQEYDEGIKELQKALDLGRANPESYMVEVIWQEVAKAKYLEWENASSKRSWELQNLKEACETALKEKHFLDDSQTEGFVDEFTNSNLEQLEALRRVFREAAEADMPTEVPDYLCCKLTLDIFRDPVITPSGVTYEKAVILDHLQKVGKFDPVTREPLDQSQLIPNLAIKEALQAFLDKHGWAYKTD